MNSHLALRKVLAAAAFMFASAWVDAAPPTFQITSLFSNLDGSVQFIRLTETAGLDGQHRFAGLKLKTIQHGVVKEFTFPVDLPTENTAHATVVVAVGNVTTGVAEHGGMSLLGVPYDIPVRFLPTDGGIVDFAGIDQVSYAALPTDGILGLLRDGTTAVVTVPYGYWCGFSSPPQRCWKEGSLEETLVRAVEYHNDTLGHYFLTASAPDIEALDSERYPGWKRTGSFFSVGAGPLVANYCAQYWDGCGPTPYTGGQVQTQPVCRFYLPPEYGDSHFLSAFASECASVRALYPSFVLESEAAFFVVPPDPVTGECPSPNGIPLVSVFRLWNGRSDTNHRFTSDLFLRNAMIDQGWVPEGYGPLGVAFCVA
jgi:hypothetical protein